MSPETSECFSSMTWLVVLEDSVNLSGLGILDGSCLVAELISSA
jgi:hypothetical protein